MSATKFQTPRMYSVQLTSLMREVLQTLGNIDFAHQVEIEKVENSRSDEALKDDIKDKLHRAHQQRRQPYVDLLTQLKRHQHHQSFAA